MQARRELHGRSAMCEPGCKVLRGGRTRYGSIVCETRTREVEWYERSAHKALTPGMAHGREDLCG